jgi:hypothetical protein
VWIPASTTDMNVVRSEIRSSNVRGLTESHDRDAGVIEQCVRKRGQQPTHGFFFVGIGRLPHRLRHLLFDAFGDLAQQRQIAIILAVDLIPGL